MKKEKDFNPLVSIIIPVYNGENYVKDAIESALKQTYKNIEIIVVNDGSKDNTEQIVKEYGDKVRYISKENGGVSTALNIAIDNMKGEYFSWLSHDDIYLGNKVEKQIEFLSKLEDKNSILYSDYCLMNSKMKRYPKDNILDEKLLNDKPEYCLLRGFLSGITLLIPKKAFDKCGYFKEELRCTQDYDMWARLLKEFKFVYCPGVYTCTRIHSMQDTQKSPKVIEEGNNLWLELVEYVDDKRKVELEGSLFDYYYEFALYLSRTFHNEAKEYCINKCKEIDEDLYLSKDINNIKKETLLQKLIRHIKQDGITNSIKIFVSRKRR